MGKGGNKVANGVDKIYTWDEVKKHTDREDKWLVINDEVFDITRWSRKHPGGSKVISHYAGQDATDAFTAFHREHTRDMVKKYMKPIRIGRMAPGEVKQKEIDKDFRDLQKVAEKMDLFTPSLFFFHLHLVIAVLFDLAGYFNLLYFGVNWFTILMSGVILGSGMAQSGWLQHDFGHLSVYKSNKLNNLVHQILMGPLKGASSTWWKHMHYQHHAKPNCMDKDPDVRVEKLFVVGNKMPLKMAEKGSYWLPYNWQHKYFPIIGPPLLFPIYFQFMLARFFWQRRKTHLWEFALFMSYYIRFAYMYVPMIGVFGTLFMYEVTRVVESTWFTWVSQSNHIPMEIDEDQERPWVPLQMHATRNVEKSFFNDWFTGHLNFQIEHHLFPTMPRHNLYKIKPFVQELCKKHNIPYIEVSLYEAFKDILRSLEKSGEMWFDAYYNFREKYD
ncbi:acyl-CoA 6-desaturase-like [Ptychodera flava]|uniref:acyl-CoA 6-desaturase-like n=1 Tax=Ptychodera flava TaxID=63121 RepID=UPI00396A18CA